jgi:hypothetical protein
LDVGDPLSSQLGQEFLQATTPSARNDRGRRCFQPREGDAKSRYAVSEQTPCHGSWFTMGQPLCPSGIESVRRRSIVAGHLEMAFAGFRDSVHVGRNRTSPSTLEKIAYSRGLVSASREGRRGPSDPRTQWKPRNGPGKAASLLREIAPWPLIDPANPRRGVTCRPTRRVTAQCKGHNPMPLACRRFPDSSASPGATQASGRPLPRQGGILAAIEPFLKHHIKQILADAARSHLRAICATPAGKHAS